MSLKMGNENAADRRFSQPIAASLALLGLLFLLAPVSSAQSHTTTSSSSSHASSSAPAAHSTSWASSSSTAHTTSSSTPSHNNAPVHHSRGYWRGGIYYPYVGTASGGSDANYATGNNEAECQGGPTIFDRCSSTPGSYIPPMSEGPAHGATPQSSFASGANSGGDSAGDSAAPTTLVFKDGHELEVENYAVVGQTLYDMTPGHSGKVPLADLDLSATQKQNQSAGAAFQMPATHQN